MINKEDFLFFVKEGCTLEELAEVFNCSPITISRYKKALNIQRANKAPQVKEGFKKCMSCNKLKKVSEYYSDTNNKTTGLRANCKVCMSASNSNHYEQNKEYYAEKHLRYKLSKKNAVPAWYSELDRFALEEAYELCRIREEETGVKHHVDHIIPLQGIEVCGLHWYKNWQVIPAKENLSKGNKLLEKHKNG